MKLCRAGRQDSLSQVNSGLGEKRFSFCEQQLIELNATAVEKILNARGTCPIDSLRKFHSTSQPPPWRFCGTVIVFKTRTNSEIQQSEGGAQT